MAVRKKIIKGGNGINFTHEVDSPADYNDVALTNDTYFIDLSVNGGMPMWKDNGGVVVSLFESGGGDTIFTGGTMSAPSTINMGGNILTFDSGRIVINQTGIEKVELNNTLSSGKQFINFNNDLGNTGAIYQAGSGASTGGNPLYAGGVFSIYAGAGAPKMIVGHSAGNPIYFPIGVFSNDNTKIKIHNNGVLLGSKVGSLTTSAAVHVRGNSILSTEIALLVQNANGVDILDVRNNGRLRAPNLEVFADDTAAGLGGLLLGDIYQTATGELRIKL